MSVAWHLFHPGKAYKTGRYSAVVDHSYSVNIAIKTDRHINHYHAVALRDELLMWLFRCTVIKVAVHSDHQVRYLIYTSQVLEIVYAYCCFINNNNPDVDA